MGNGPVKLTNNLFAKAVANRKPHLSAGIRFAVSAVIFPYSSPGLAVNACARKSVRVAPGQKIVTSMLGCSIFRLSKYP